jgi:hypothetical protein
MAVLAGRGLFSGREWLVSLNVGIATGQEELLGDTEVAGTRETREASCAVEWVLAAGISKDERCDIGACWDCLDRGR